MQGSGWLFANVRSWFLAPDPLPSGAQVHGDVGGASWLRCARPGPGWNPRPVRSFLCQNSSVPLRCGQTPTWLSLRPMFADRKPTLVLARRQQGSVRRCLRIGSRPAPVRPGTGLGTPAFSVPCPIHHPILPPPACREFSRICALLSPHCQCLQPTWCISLAVLTPISYMSPPPFCTVLTLS